MAIPPAPPVYDRDDVAGQLVVQVLQAALEGPLPSPALWTPHRLMTRATTAVNRATAEESELRDEVAPEDIGDRSLSSSAMFSLAEISAEVSAGRIPAAPLRIASRRASGESMSDLAGEAGEKVRVFSRRQQRAMKGIREHLAA